VKPALYDFFLHQAYKWSVSLGVGLFFYLFLLVFLPFGVSNYDPNHEYSLAFIIEIGSFLLATISLLLLNEFFIKPRVVKRAALKEVLLWSAWSLVVLGVGNYLLYNWLGDWHDLSWSSAFGFVWNTSTVFVFPFLGIFFYFHYQNLKSEYTKMSTDQRLVRDPEALIHFAGQGSSDLVAISAKDFRYAQAQDNYVALHYLQNGREKTELIRSTISDLIEKTDCRDLIRCHRSFAVNLRQVHSYTGAHPLKLYLNDISHPISVSRTYRKHVLQHLSSASGTN
jgi:hypothetical protein